MNAAAPLSSSFATCSHSAVPPPAVQARLLEELLDLREEIRDCLGDGDDALIGTSATSCDLYTLSDRLRQFAQRMESQSLCSSPLKPQRSHPLPHISVTLPIYLPSLSEGETIRRLNLIRSAGNRCSVRQAMEICRVDNDTVYRADQAFWGHFDSQVKAQVPGYMGLPLPERRRRGIARAGHRRRVEVVSAG